MSKNPDLKAEKKITVHPPEDERKKGYLTNKPVIVIINEGSASSSELVSGALQVFNRALIVGTPHSFGKGTLHLGIPMFFYDGISRESLMLTHGYFYLPSGKSNQHVGISSDIVLYDWSRKMPDLLEKNLPMSFKQPESLLPDEIEDYSSAMWMSHDQKQEIIEELVERLKTKYGENYLSQEQSAEETLDRGLFLLNHFIQWAETADVGY